MWTMVFGLLGGIPGLLGKFLDWNIQRANVTLEGFKVGATVDAQAYQAYLNAQVEINRMKLAANGWWGAKLIIIVTGGSAAIHFGAVCLDSTPFPYLTWGTWWFTWATHAQGSWAVVSLPKPYDEYEWKILQSFFIVAPAIPLVNATAAWLSRKT